MNSEQASFDYSAEDLTGASLGDYQIIRRLGRGGMAEVYLAEQLSLKRNVALKVLKSELARDQSYVDRFRREAQSAAALVQSNIVQIYEVGEAQGRYFIAQEYIQGRNLRQYLDRHGAVEPIMAVSIMRQISMALQKAGEMNVIHRDIKPENIMLSTKGEVKVADFGLARVNDEVSRQDLTQIGITMGTPLYMSPEQVEGRKVDPRSDIYSLGVTAYHMLAGIPPFEGENALSIALQHVKNDPEPLNQLRPDIPIELANLIHRMMAKDPEQRPESGGHVLRELRKIRIESVDDWECLVEKLATSDTSHSGTLTLPESRLAVTRQLQSVMHGNVKSWWARPTTIAMFAILLVLGVAAGIWAANQNPIPDPIDLAVSRIPKIPRQETAKEQYRYAHARPSEDNYSAVLEYFPVDQAAPDQVHTTILYRNWAKERLGELYLTQDPPSWDLAEPIYLEFTEIGDSERLKTVGHAGLAVIYEATDRKDKMRLHLAEIEDRQIELLNEIFHDQVVRLKKKYGSTQVFADLPVDPLTVRQSWKISS